MSVTQPNAASNPAVASQSGLRLTPAQVLLALLTLGVAGLFVGYVGTYWAHDVTLSHGSIVFVISLALLWMSRDQFEDLSKADTAGLIFLVFSTVLFLASAWIDVDFLKPLSMIMAVGGIFWYLGGPIAARAAASPLGLLVFTIPWPTSFTEHCAFPVQLVSSAWAAQLAGAIGIPIYRQGVYLAVLHDGSTKPIYEIVVAQACSGLTSLVVLMALGYMFAYFTPVRWPWKLLLATIVIPLALVLNSIRLAVILWFGAHYSADVAQWVHHHEQPVLVFFSSFLLLGLRHLLLEWTAPPDKKATVQELRPCNDIVS